MKFAIAILFLTFSTTVYSGQVCGRDAAVFEKNIKVKSQESEKGSVSVLVEATSDIDGKKLSRILLRKTKHHHLSVPLEIKVVDGLGISRFHGDKSELNNMEIRLYYGLSKCRIVINRIVPIP